MKQSLRQGFTLVQISMLLVVASLVLVAVLPSTRTSVNLNNATTNKLNAVLTSMRTYEAAHAALPCPADASQPILSTNYGVAAANPGTTTNCSGGSPAANYVDATNHVAVGMVPVRALGLSNDYALDAYGRDITYAVDTNATVCFAGTLPGQITVTDNGTATTTIAALISHGSDGHGAWIPLTGSSGSAVRLNSGSTDVNTLLNAHVNSSFAPYTPLTNFVRGPITSTFDDLVTYKSNLWPLNTVPVVTSAFLPTMQPLSGNYYTGGTLSFTVTFSGAVTVTGSPELTLAIPQYNGTTATRYATYSAINSTPLSGILIFNYTVLSSDFAPTFPSNVGVTSPIVLNGGAIATPTGPACLTFKAPSLTGILLNPIFIYVGDTGGSRVQWFNMNAAYVGQFDSPNPSTYGTDEVAVDANGNFWIAGGEGGQINKFNSAGTLLNTVGNAVTQNNPLIDSSGNLWASDGGSCVTEYSPTATGQNDQWLVDMLRIGPPGGQYNYCQTGSGIGEFNGTAGIAFDSSGNLWVVDSGNYRIQEFTHAGSYIKTIGGGASCTSCVSTTSCTCTQGNTGGLLENPFGIAIDIAGNVFVSDDLSSAAPNNAQIVVYNSSGSFLRQFGSQGGGAGQFGGNWNGPNGLAIDLNGALWVADGADYRVEQLNGCGLYINSIGSGYNGTTGSQGSYGTGNGQFGGPSNNPYPSPWNIYVTPTTPGYAGTCITSVTPPANGVYATGSPLNFTVTYNAAVTVTGSPELVLNIGGTTRYAVYNPTSSTPASGTLIFTYTVQAGDSATGITATGNIFLNGGAITSGIYNTNTNFPAPAMGGILLNITSYMLVADYGNQRVQALTLNGTYMDQIGCASGACVGGSTNGVFSGPRETALDSSGNIWVVDRGNNRVQEFNSSGTWLGQIGGVGVCSACMCTGPSTCSNANGNGNGQLNTPEGIAIDSSNNVWVGDAGNNRVEEFDNSGNFKQVIGGSVYGCAATQFKDPQYIKLDSSGNIYVADSVCGEIQEFTSAGSYIKTIGPTIPSYGTLSADLDDIAFDSCGNMWIQDEGNSMFFQTDYAGNFIQHVTLPGSGEQALAIDSSGNIYDLDEDTDDNIHLFNSSGVYQTDIGAGPGAGQGQFHNALGLTIVGSSVTRLPLSGCSAVILSAAGPANGNYTSGTLGFAVTYDQAVTVTGTPYINVTIGGNTRQASYISGSGTTTLTFQYTVQASDYAASGITMNAPINLNGGTITTNAGSLAAGLYFQPPTLTGVSVGTTIQIFLTASQTWTVPSNWNNTGNSIEAVGCGGNGSQGSSTTGGAGGGGGEYRKASNVTLTVGNPITVTVASGGAASSTSFVNGATTVALANCGGNASGTTAGSGGSGGTGATHHNGGAGATDGGTTAGGAGGGGGAAGPSGTGKGGAAGGNTEGGGGGGGGSNGGSAGTAGTATHGAGGNGGNGFGGTGGQTGSAGNTTASTNTSAGSAGTAGSGAGGAGSGGNSGTGTSMTGAGGNGAIDAPASWSSNTSYGTGGGGGGSGGSKYSTAAAGGNGGTYGGGGGGSGASGSGTSGAGGSGGQGLIVITYGSR